MRVANQEQPFHPLYNYAFVTDAEEGLILVDVNTLADGEPRNNDARSSAHVESRRRRSTARGTSRSAATICTSWPTRGLVVVNVDSR